MENHPQSLIDSRSVVVKCQLHLIYSFGRCVIFIFWVETAYSRPLLGSLGSIFPPSDLIHCANPDKVPLSHKAWKMVQWFDLGACPSKKDRTVKKSQKWYISHTWRKAPTEPICIKFTRVLASPTYSHLPSFKIKFSGFTIFRGRIFCFSIDFCMGLITCSANALPVKIYCHNYTSYLILCYRTRNYP